MTELTNFFHVIFTGTSSLNVVKTLSELRRTEMVLLGLDPKTLDNLPAFKLMGDDYITQIFLQFYYANLPKMIQEFEKVPCRILTIDHSMKVPSKVGIRYANGCQQQFKCIIMFMNEEGRIKNFCFTKSESIDEIEPILSGIQQSGSIEMIITGEYV